MRQFKFKEHIVQVYLQCYGSPAKRAGLSGSSCLQGQRKQNLDDMRFDAVELCFKRQFTQCSKCNVGFCVGCNLNYNTL